MSSQLILADTIENFLYIYNSIEMNQICAIKSMSNFIDLSPKSRCKMHHTLWIRKKKRIRNEAKNKFHKIKFMETEHGNKHEHKVKLMQPN